MTPDRRQHDPVVAQLAQDVAALAESVEQVRSLVASLSDDVAKLHDATAGVVQFYGDVQGTVRVGAALQAFCLWVAKWGVIGSAAAAAVYWIIDHAPRPPA